MLGTDFVAMKLGVETLHVIQYKLRMMVIPISWPTYICGDSQKKKHLLSLVLYDILMRIPNNGCDLFPDYANPFHYLM